MQLKSREVIVDDVTFVVHELSARVMLPLVQHVSEAEGDQEAQIEMMNAAISLNGEKVDAGELGMKAFMTLMNHIQDLNGMLSEEGNDLPPDELPSTT